MAIAASAVATKGVEISQLALATLPSVVAFETNRQRSTTKLGDAEKGTRANTTNLTNAHYSSIVSRPRALERKAIQLNSALFFLSKTSSTHAISQGLAPLTNSLRSYTGFAENEKVGHTK